MHKLQLFIVVGAWSMPANTPGEGDGGGCYITYTDIVVWLFEYYTLTTFKHTKHNIIGEVHSTVAAKVYVERRQSNRIGSHVYMYVGALPTCLHVGMIHTCRCGGSYWGTENQFS